jgi:hypothetical protein
MKRPELTDPRLRDPADPMKITPELHEYIKNMPDRHHVWDQIDHENLRWKGQ